MNAFSFRAMGGQVLFQDALAARLNIIQPSQQDVHTFLRERPFHLTAGIAEVVDLLHRLMTPPVDLTSPISRLLMC